MSTSETGKLDFFELGDKTSLVCADSATQSAVRASLRDLGFKSHAVETAEAAMDRIRYTRYDCIVIHEQFGGGGLSSNTVLNYLAPMPMAQRRHSFVCLIGPSCKTLDAMQAFSLSVHLVVNPMDLPNLTAIMKKSLAEFEMTYRIYKETLVAQPARV